MRDSGRNAAGVTCLPPALSHLSTLHLASGHSKQVLTSRINVSHAPWLASAALLAVRPEPLSRPQCLALAPHQSSGSVYACSLLNPARSEPLDWLNVRQAAIP